MLATLLIIMLSVVLWILHLSSKTPRSTWHSCTDEHIQSGRYSCYFVTGSIARSANLPVFSLLRGRLRFFAPQGRHVAPMGVKFGTEEGTLRRGPKVPSSVPNFTPNGATTRYVGPQIEIFSQI